MKAKAKGLGYGGVVMYYHLEGKSSPVKCKNDVTFAMRVKEEGIDPATLLILSKCNASGKKREVKAMKMSAFGGLGSGGKSIKKDHLEVKIEKIEGTTYKIVPAQKLEAGEYAFYAPSGGGVQTTMLFCFSVE